VLNDNSPLSAAETQKELRDLGIDSRRFFCPLHLQPLAKNYQIDTFGNMPIAERLWQRGIYLPSGLGNTFEEIDRTIEAMWKLVKR
jgi:perosamine synthetase